MLIIWYTIQVTIHPIRMKVFVCFAAICFLSLVVVQDATGELSVPFKAPGGFISPKGRCML